MEEKRLVSDEEFIKLYNKLGGNKKLIAKEVGYHIQSVNRKCKKLGLVEVTTYVSSAEITELYETYRGDIKSIAKHCGLKDLTVRKRLKAIGLLKPKEVISDEAIIEACNSSSNMEVARKKLGMPGTSFKRRAVHLGVYKSNQGDLTNRRGSYSRGIPLDKILNGEYPTYRTYDLKHRLYREGILKDECSNCGFDKKRDGFEFSVCEMNHINGNPNDHRLENLEILCPNCHALTPNYRNVSRSE